VKIRFNMEIRGCRWRKGNMELYCPYYNPISHSYAPYCDKADMYITGRSGRNPSWCPMMKGRDSEVKDD
jgi:hypothetical protein